jgi:MerR family transcriptional regulator, light-induced transcriptional regulator
MDKTAQIDQLTSALGISLAEQLEVALNAGDIAILQDFLCWKRTRFLSQGYSEQDVVDLFENIRTTFSDGMDPAAGEKITQFIDDAIRYLDCKKQRPDTTVDPLSELSANYRAFLLAGDRKQASTLILDSAAAGTPVRDIYLHVFQNSLYEIGRLWQTNQITIAQEHFFTAATQMIMSQLYPYIFAHQKNGLRMIAASVDSNMHDIGIRMVADFFEMDGWDTYYLGGNAPSQAIIQALQETNPHLLALSATISKQIPIIERVIQGVREYDQSNQVKVIVGGPPFNISENLWKKVGSDGFATSADEAVSLANRLFELDGHP